MTNQQQPKRGFGIPAVDPIVFEDNPEPPELRDNLAPTPTEIVPDVTRTPVAVTEFPEQEDEWIPGGSIHDEDETQKPVAVTDHLGLRILIAGIPLALPLLVIAILVATQIGK